MIITTPARWCCSCFCSLGRCCGSKEDDAFMGHPAARFAASYKSSVAMAAHSKTLSHYRTKEMFDRANRSETTNYTPVRSMTLYPI